jgi:hypothetical protein
MSTSNAAPSSSTRTKTDEPCTGALDAGVAEALRRWKKQLTLITGHKSSQRIYRYKRQARFHAELNLGTLRPLHEAIPEVARVRG